MTGPAVFTLRSAEGLQIDVTTAGASWMSCRVPMSADPAAEPREVLLGYASAADYLTQPGYLGAIVGRHANRIAGAAFELDGTPHALRANEGPHQLHGGPEGFHCKVWTVAAHTPTQLTLTLQSPAGDQGFPGALQVQVTYELMPALTVRLTLEATTSAPTLCNLSSHAYFNLDGDARDIRSHRLQLPATHYLPVRPDLIPTGEQAAVAGTPFDFRTARVIGEALQSLQATGAQPRCHDHCWLAGQARLVSSDGALALDLHSDQPGLQFYAGEFLHRTPDRRGQPYPAHAGLALEPQTLPDSPHHPEWPQRNAVLRPGEAYRHTFTYRFTPASAA